MRATSLILALAMQSVMTASLAQEAKTPVGRPIPEEHKNSWQKSKMCSGNFQRRPLATN
jgi:hypothetical protein